MTRHFNLRPYVICKCVTSQASISERHISYPDCRPI